MSQQFLARLALVSFFFTTMPPPASASTSAIQKPIKNLLNGIRYGRYDLAAKQLNFAEMAETLLADQWAKMADSDKQEMVKGLETIIRATTFKRGNEMFKHLDAVLYDPPTQKDSQAECKSTIVVHRNYKKTEIVIEWLLSTQDGAWQIYDMRMLGERTSTGIREEEINPLLKSGGVPAVMKAFREKVAEVTKK